MSEMAPPPGRFVLCDLWTPDLEAAKRFYLALFPAWQLAPESDPQGFHHRITMGDRSIGGVVTVDPRTCTTPRWVPYFTVKDVDATCEAVKEQGGAVHRPPAEIPHVGRFAAAADPQGASFSLIALAQEPPEHSGPMPAGAFCWLELLTTSTAAAATFYPAVLGWAHAEVPMGASPYHLFRRGERDAAGMAPAPPDAQDPPGWLAYVYTSDMDASLARVTDLGGRISRSATHVPGVGHFAVVADPLGGKLALFRSERG